MTLSFICDIISLVPDGKSASSSAPETINKRVQWRGAQHCVNRIVGGGRNLYEFFALNPRGKVEGVFSWLILARFVVERTKQPQSSSSAASIIYFFISVLI